MEMIATSPREIELTVLQQNVYGSFFVKWSDLKTIIQ